MFCQTKNHWYQWFAKPKNIGTNGLPDQNHCKTIDTNGCFPTIHSVTQVSMKAFK